MPPAIKYPRDIAWKTTHDEAIAARLGIHVNTVRRHRRDRKKPKGPRKPGSGLVRRVKREKIDLSKSVKWNARVLRCHPNYARRLMRETRKAIAKSQATARTLGKKLEVMMPVRKKVAKQKPKALEAWM